MTSPALVAHAVLRTAVAVAGGYAVVSLAVTLGASLLARGLLQPSDAVVTAAMLGFVAYLALLLWALACPRLLPLCGGLGGAGVLLHGLQRLLAP
ncbi:hypothetical protein GCM10007320_21000 [Pseudorhodoferax aquiterrae]|uniref:Iron transporter n=1 Tax=Pseudorhodoferax aquiterrae TaxID=747304 RepID=A0ABQ3FZZ3_9BURK|nr:hypothetical protein [Pseudorhodoferax aquiterrae]GHC79814.1 hypothetical protein GCM10007320_21000 [Pseudorhodoferax aquiterrae]